MITIKRKLIHEIGKFGTWEFKEPVVVLDYSNHVEFDYRTKIAMIPKCSKFNELIEEYLKRSAIFLTHI